MTKKHQETELKFVSNGHINGDANGHLPRDNPPPGRCATLVNYTQEQWNQYVAPVIRANAEPIVWCLAFNAIAPFFFYDAIKWMYKEIPDEALGIIFGFMGGLGIEMRRPSKEYKEDEERPTRSYEISTMFTSMALGAVAAYYFQYYLIPGIPIPLPAEKELIQLVNEKAVYASFKAVVGKCFPYFGNETAAVICAERNFDTTNITDLNRDKEFAEYSAINAGGGLSRNALKGFLITTFLPWIAAMPIKWAIDKTTPTVTRCLSSLFSCRRKSNTIIEAYEPLVENDDTPSSSPISTASMP